MEKVVIKLSGELFASTESLKKVVEQIKKISLKNQIGIVIGAGNIFRGEQHGKSLNLNPANAHFAGMVATIINSLILKDLLIKQDLKVKILSAIPVPTIADNITQEKIDLSLNENKIIIFAGGTGNPFFSTDTNAVLRALQLNSSLVLKGTKTEGIFDSDPEKNKNAKLLKTLSFDDFLKNNLQVMDLTAITLAKKNNLKIKVFNIFEKDSLLKVFKDPNFGSTIS
ncbi:UMP kinase [Candidatus Dependentiae bacterium]|nr:UMP kinase [Candidatus Dependentiae bacterium]